MPPLIPGTSERPGREVVPGKILRELAERLTRARRYMLFYWFPILHARRCYHSRTGKRLRYRKVQDLNEKLFWLERYWPHPLVARCTDKFAVREYVESRGFGSLLNELYGVYETPGEVDFDALPDQFVLKCNHGCGYNIFCADKSSFDRQAAIERLETWMKESFGASSAEWHYANIRRRIMAERFIPHEEYGLMDYQIYCFNGQPKFFLVRNDRGGKLPEGFAISYTLDWSRLPHRAEEKIDTECDEPSYREEMIHFAAALSQGFPFVRVDFYGPEERFYFGELTFSPIGNVLSSYKPEVLAELGKQLALPPKYRRVARA